MSVDDEVTTNDLHLEPGDAVDVAADARSLLDKISKRRAEREDVLTIDIPSWDGELRAKYQLLDRKEIEKMVRRVRARLRDQAQRDDGSTADLDFLIRACVGVVAYDEENDREVSIANGYSMDLVGILQPKFPKGHPQEGQDVPIKDQRELVSWIIGWNNVALATHGQAIARWMQDTSKSPVDPQ